MQELLHSSAYNLDPCRHTHTPQVGPRIFSRRRAARLMQRRLLQPLGPQVQSLLRLHEEGPKKQSSPASLPRLPSLLRKALHARDPKAEPTPASSVASLVDPDLLQVTADLLGPAPRPKASTHVPVAFPRISEPWLAILLHDLQILKSYRQTQSLKHRSLHHGTPADVLVEIEW